MESKWIFFEAGHSIRESNAINEHIYIPDIYKAIAKKPQVTFPAALLKHSFTFVPHSCWRYYRVFNRNVITHKKKLVSVNGLALFKNQRLCAPVLPGVNFLGLFWNTQILPFSAVFTFLPKHQWLKRLIDCKFEKWKTEPNPLVPVPCRSFSKRGFAPNEVPLRLVMTGSIILQSLKSLVQIRCLKCLYWLSSPEELADSSRTVLGER